MTFLAVLESMWDWESRTSNAGYEEAPNFFRINPHNHSGRRLYQLTGLRDGLWCTNVCPELVSGPDQHGTPSPERLQRNLLRWDKMLHHWLAGGERDKEMLGEGYKPPERPTILCCGTVVQDKGMACLPATFLQELARVHRFVYLPHPAARNWSKPAVARAASHIQQGRAHLRMRLAKGGVLEVRTLWGDAS